MTLEQAVCPSEPDSATGSSDSVPDSVPDSVSDSVIGDPESCKTDLDVENEAPEQKIQICDDTNGLGHSETLKSSHEIVQQADNCDNDHEELDMEIHKLCSNDIEDLVSDKHPGEVATHQIAIEPQEVVSLAQQFVQLKLDPGKSTEQCTVDEVMHILYTTLHIVGS
jgi:hypothetical protein